MRLSLAVLMAAVLMLGTVSATQAQSCYQDYWGFTQCTGGYSCGRVSLYWGETRCSTSAGSAFQFNWPGYGPSGRESRSTSWWDSGATIRLPSVSDSWYTPRSTSNSPMGRWYQYEQCGWLC